MHTLAADELKRAPEQQIDDARRGHAVTVTVEGEPVLMVHPQSGAKRAAALRA